MDKASLSLSASFVFFNRPGGSTLCILFLPSYYVYTKYKLSFAMVACNALIQNEQLELQLVYRFPCLRRIASFRKKRIKFCNARAARPSIKRRKKILRYPDYITLTV